MVVRTQKIGVLNRESAEGWLAHALGEGRPSLRAFVSGAVFEPQLEALREQVAYRVEPLAGAPPAEAVALQARRETVARLASGVRAHLASVQNLPRTSPEVQAAAARVLDLCLPWAVTPYTKVGKVANLRFALEKGALACAADLATLPPDAHGDSVGASLTALVGHLEVIASLHNRPGEPPASDAGAPARFRALVRLTAVANQMRATLAMEVERQPALGHHFAVLFDALDRAADESRAAGRVRKANAAARKARSDARAAEWAELARARVAQKAASKLARTQARAVAEAAKAQAREAARAARAAGRTARTPTPPAGQASARESTGA